MKKLPKIYQNEITKNINNNKKYCYLEEERSIPSEKVEKMNSISVKEELDNIFSGFGYSYNIPIIIKTSSKEYKTSLVSRTKNNVVTIENEIIPITEIISIERI